MIWLETGLVVYFKQNRKDPVFMYGVVLKLDKESFAVLLLDRISKCIK